MHRIPKDHPRYSSLRIRQRMVSGWRRGLAVPEGLLAHGRGEAFDYLLGERTQPEAVAAIRAAAATLLLARHPVLSVNGNVAALAPESMAALARSLPSAVLEVNLFHRSEARARRIAARMKRLAGRRVRVLGPSPDARLPGLSSPRARSFKEGMLSADVVLVPLEDGDRTEALRRSKKKVVAVDLNPLSRTARTASITIVDNVIRALPELTRQVCALRRRPPSELKRLATRFDNRANLACALGRMLARLRALSERRRALDPAGRRA